MAERPAPCDILITGTGNLAERMVCDIATTAPKPLRITIAARPVERERLEWLRVAGNSRAAIMSRPVYYETDEVDWSSPENIAETIRRWQPKLVIHAASVQSAGVVYDRVTQWGKVVKVGGLSATVVFQSLLSSRIGKAIQMAAPDALFCNCCYPDLTNGVLKGIGLPVVCGFGNIEILAVAFAGELGIRERGRVRLLAHHQHLYPFRGPAEERTRRPPRVWIDGKEIDDVYPRFKRVRLTREPAIPISGCTGVPVIYALSGLTDYVGHVPGPYGRPGGYPVTIKDRRIALDLPAGVTEQDAIAFNVAFELENGLTVDDAGNLRYHGPLHETLKGYSPELAAGFNVRDIEKAYPEMEKLREKLTAQPV